MFAEEFGFVGSMMLLLFLMLMAWLGLRVALRCRSNQSRLVAIGCCTILVGQSILNIAVASGAMSSESFATTVARYARRLLLGRRRLPVCEFAAV